MKNLLSEEIRDKDEFVCAAIQFYLRECKKKCLAEQMKQGYLDMSEINLSICGENLLIEEEALCNCMQKWFGG